MQIDGLRQEQINRKNDYNEYKNIVYDKINVNNEKRNGTNRINSGPMMSSPKPLRTNP